MVFEELINYIENIDELIISVLSDINHRETITTLYWGHESASDEQLVKSNCSVTSSLMAILAKQRFDLKPSLHESIPLDQRFRIICIEIFREHYLSIVQYWNVWKIYQSWENKYTTEEYNENSRYLLKDEIIQYITVLSKDKELIITVFE